MPQTLFLLPALPDPNWLRDRHAEGLLRAVAEFPGAEFAGLALLTSEGVHAEESARVSGLAAGFGPISIPILPIPVPIPTPVTAHLPEMAVILFVLCKIAEGQQQSTAAELAELADERSAFAHAFHDGSFNMVMEFVGEELEETLTRALIATDRGSISNVRVLHTTASFTRGFGGDAPAS